MPLWKPRHTCVYMANTDLSTFSIFHCTQTFAYYLYDNFQDPQYTYVETYIQFSFTSIQSGFFKILYKLRKILWRVKWINLFIEMQILKFLYLTYRKNVCVRILCILFTKIFLKSLSITYNIAWSDLWLC